LICRLKTAILQGESRSRRDLMIAISGVYEIAVRVHDLGRSERFYRDALGLTVGRREETRRWVFLRAGGVAGMMVLQEEPGDWPRQHFAFTVAEADIDRAAEELRRKGVHVDGPVVHGWIPAESLYFEDPDGHDVELCAPLAGTGDASSR
jgi:lactoylglutathione lyase